MLIDISKLLTLSNYGRKVGRSRAIISHHAEKGEVDGKPVIRIDGVPFIYNSEVRPERLPEAGEPSQEPKKDTKFKPI